MFQRELAWRHAFHAVTLQSRMPPHAALRRRTPPLTNARRPPASSTIAVATVARPPSVFITWCVEKAMIIPWGPLSDVWQAVDDQSKRQLSFNVIAIWYEPAHCLAYCPTATGPAPERWRFVAQCSLWFMLHDKFKLLRNVHTEGPCLTLQWGCWCC